MEEYDGPSRPHSPLHQRAQPRRAHSAAERQELAHITKARDKHQRGSPSVEYARFEATSSHNDADYHDVVRPKSSVISFIDEIRYEGPVPVTRGPQRENEPTYPRKIPVRYVEGVRKPAARAGEPHKEEQFKEPSRAHDYTVEEAESVSARSHGHHDTFDVRSTSTHEHPDWERAARDHSSFSSRSSEARRRRRRERVVPEVQPWEAPHDIDLDTDADVVVVTERYEYRRPQHNEESRRAQEYVDRTQEYVDRTTLDAHREPQKFSADDAARYFNNDWAGPEPIQPPPAPIRRPAPPIARQSFRRDRIREPSPDSESSYDYTISRGKNFSNCSVFHTNQPVGNPLPRAPTPPSPLARPEADHWELRSEHREYLDTEDPNGRVGREDTRAGQRSRQSEGTRSTSTTRSGHDRNSRPEPARTPSPSRSRQDREHLTMISEGSIADSGMTERERMAELGARHVTFRDTPSERSATAWPSFESSPTKHDRFEDGWDNGDSRGNGSQW